MSMKATQDDLWRMRAMIQKLGWGEFMRHVGSMMAEQADNLPEGEQNTNLFNCSNTIHALLEFFEKCGTFDYKSHPFTPEEYQGLFE